MSNSKFPIDLALTDVSVAYKNGEFIADRISPIVSVPRSTGYYWEWVRADQVRKGASLRANGSASHRVNFNAVKKSFGTEEYAFHIGITEQDRRDADPALDIETSETELLTNLLLTDREIRVAEFFRNTANYEGDNVEAKTGTSRWDNVGYTGDPLAEIDGWREEVRRSSGKYPNKMIISPEAAVALGNNATFREHYKYTYNDIADGSPLPKTIRGMEVIISTAQASLGNEGNDALSDIWGNDLILVYVNNGGKLKEVSFTYTLRTSEVVGSNGYGLRTRKWDDMDTKTTKIETETSEVVQSIAKGAGFLVQSVVG